VWFIDISGECTVSVSRVRERKPSKEKGLHSILSQKIVFFIVTAVRTSNPDLGLHYKDQPVNDVANNHCLLRESYETNKYTV
jgi:hypothetical protein